MTNDLERTIIKEEFGIQYSKRQIERILRKLGMNLMKPYARDVRRPKDAEEQLFNELDRVFNTLKEEGVEKEKVVLGYFDESSPQLTANTARIWTFDKKPIIEKNTERIKLNAAGFYALKCNSILSYLQRSTQDDIIKFLEEVKAANQSAHAIIVILDNFRSHKALRVLARAKELGIYLVFLPKYSPDLNPIEFIWKSIKRVVSISFIKDKPTFQETVANAFASFSQKLSYARSWITSFFNPIWNCY